MKLIIGVAMVVAGIVLLGLGINAADAPLAQISRAFTGQPIDRAIMFWIAGALSIAAGLAAMLLPRKS